MLLLCSTQLGAEKINKYVTTLINAKWNETPLILEAAEYLSDENPSFFWKFIDAFSNKINNFVIGNYLVIVELIWKHS
jgi:UDP-glucose:glycoprotein glucosyltransferase